MNIPPPASSQVHPPHPLSLAIRVVVVTWAVGMLGFALGGLIGIIATATMNVTGAHQSMYAALWYYAIPAGVIGGAVGLVLIIRSEQKEAHERKQAAAHEEARHAARRPRPRATPISY